MLKSNNLLKNTELQYTTVLISTGAYLIAVASILFQLAHSVTDDPIYVAYTTGLLLPFILAPIIGYFIGTRTTLKKASEKRLNGILAAYLAFSVYIILDIIAGLLLIIDQYPYSGIAIIKSLTACGAASIISYYIATKAPKKLLITSHLYQSTAITLAIIVVGFATLLTASSATNTIPTGYSTILSLMYTIPLLMLALSYAVLDPNLDRTSRATQAVALTAVGIALLWAGMEGIRSVIMWSSTMTYFDFSFIAIPIATGIWLAYMWPLVRRRFR